jgi:hypothetical protein
MRDAIDRILQGEKVSDVLEDISITTTAVGQLAGHKQYKVGNIHRRKGLKRNARNSGVVKP